MKDCGYEEFIESGISMIAESEIELDEEKFNKLEELIENLEDLEDVSEVFTNVKYND